MILVVDNYDSFVHNVARHFTMLGQHTEVVRNDTIDLATIGRKAPDAIVLSPGPCAPAQAGISTALLRAFSGVVPILGVCLGHQAIGEVFGGRISRARHPLHGQASAIRHDGARLFAGLPNPLAVGRYHSLVVEATPAMAGDLIVDASSDEGEIMALSHRRHPTFGVQFHPESVLTSCGLDLFRNFLACARAHSRVTDAVA